VLNHRRSRNVFSLIPRAFSADKGDGLFRDAQDPSDVKSTRFSAAPIRVAEFVA